MYISKLKVFLKPSNATSKEISNPVEGKPSSNRAATPPCKREKAESNVPVIDLEEVPTTYVDYTLAAPWQSIGRTALKMNDIISGDKLNDKHVNFAQMLIKQHFTQWYCQHLNLSQKQQMFSRLCTLEKIIGYLHLKKNYDEMC